MVDSLAETMPIKLVLFVCTGNTCRSPMAAALFNEMAAGNEFRAESAGLAAFAGDPASDPSIRALAYLGGLDLAGHRSRSITPYLVDSAEWILTMTTAQAQTLRQIFPEAAAKIHSLGEMTGMGQVSDPFGGDDDVYLATALQLQSMVGRLVKILQKST